MIDDGYRSLDHAIEILRGCVAPYSGEQAQKVAVVLKQWHDKWEAAVDVIYPDERDTIKTLKAEVERMRVVIDMAHDALVASQWSDSTNYGCTACCPDCRETDEHSSSCDHAKAIEACRSALEVDEALRRAGGAP